MEENGEKPKGLILGLVHTFLTSKLSLFFVAISLLLGVAAVSLTPREEEPQIVVPMADVYVSVPGASPEEIEKLVATPLEKLLWQLDGVEYVYSMSGHEMAVVTVRFYVGQNREDSLVKLHNRIMMNVDKVPSIVKGWVVKPVEIDDVPIVNLTLYSEKYNDHELHRIGEEALSRLAEVKNTSGTSIVGGRTREIRVELQPERMAGFGVSLLEVQNALRGTDASVRAGDYTRFNNEFTVSVNSFLRKSSEVSDLVVGVNKGRPVYLKDIATIIDGPEEVSSYTNIGFSNRERNENAYKPESAAAVTLAISKKKGTNAVTVANDVLLKLEELKKTVIPDGVNVEVTRNYGYSAQGKVNELLRGLLEAIIIVVVLIIFSMGWKESVVVALSIPVSFALALFVNLLLGYTINRVTLFALILSLGLVVDDPIMNVDNIQRHMLSGRFKNSIDAALFAVKEVLRPVIISTLTIIACFVPLFFITGMMGPYMAPMAINVPMALIFSLISSLTFVPWLSHTLIKRSIKPTDAGHTGGHNEESGSWAKSVGPVYRKIVEPLLDSSKKRNMFFGGIFILLVFSVLLAVFRIVPLKLLPFDNKNEFMIILDMPEGTGLEKTAAAVNAFEAYLKTVPEVTNFVSYTGMGAPMDFNGMVRHYYLRKGSNLADIQVNLADKHRRKAQSHAIVLRLRTDLEAIAIKHGALIKLVETPPGPPVLSTVVAEIYGKPDSSYAELLYGSEKIKKMLGSMPYVSDIDSSAEADRKKLEIRVDREKAALHGVSAQEIVGTLQAAIQGTVAATVHESDERQALGIRIVLPRDKRTGEASIAQIPVKTASGDMVPIAELVNMKWVDEFQPIYHKNLERVVFTYAEMAGKSPVEAIFALKSDLKKNPLPEGIKADLAGEGEWKITVDVFRDMGIAFGVAMIAIYLLLVIQSGSYSMPVLIMTSIPLTLLGIMPGFVILNIVSGGKSGGFDNPVFLTATSMIGMIALGGIVIRNSLILIEFIEESLKEGLSLKEALLKSGAIRIRPIFLTAASAALGAWPITKDPVFSGLAWALIFGLTASTVFTLVVIPVAYYAFFGGTENKTA